MRQSHKSRPPQRILRRRNHLGIVACLVSVLIVGIVIGRVSRGPDDDGQVFLNNAAPPAASHEATPRSGHDRAPLGKVKRESTPVPVVKRSPRTQRPSKAPHKAVRPGPVKSTMGEATIGSLVDAPGENGAESVRPLYSMETEVVRLTNAARRKAGCRPLRIEQRLMRSARVHSIEMAKSGQFDHNSPDGSTPWQRMDRVGYRDGGAENIGRGYQTAGEAVRGWLGSRSHRANMLNCSMAAIGVGVASGSGGPWWTQDFGYS